MPDDKAGKIARESGEHEGILDADSGIAKDPLSPPAPQKVEVYGTVTGTDLPRTRKKVAIVGFAPSTMRDVAAVFDDPDFEIWSINQLYIAFPEIVEKTTRWFQIHHRHSYDQAVRDHTHHDWLSKQTAFPIYMQKKEEGIPLSVEFPRHKITDYFGRYFTNTISWEIALAILEGFEVIHIYGVDMAQDEEYCVGLDTRVLTADLQWIPAVDVKVGSEVIAFDENIGPETEGPHSFRQWRVAKVEKAEVITRPCYRIHLSDGTELVSSQEHRWLTYAEHINRWKPTNELITSTHREGRPTKLVKVLDTWGEENSREAGYLAGAFDGEGWLTQSAHSHCNGNGLVLGFSQRDNAMAQKVRGALDAFHFDYSESSKGDCHVFNIKGGRSEIMRFLGQIRPYRLLDNFNPHNLGSMQRKDAVAVEKTEFIGEQKVVALKTSEGTFIAEGFASHNSEQRPSCEMFIGWARGAGIKVYIPEKSDLCKSTWLYPYEDDSPFRVKIDSRRIELRQRVNQLGAQEQGMRDERMQILGALENMNYVQKCWAFTRREITIK